MIWLSRWKKAYKGLHGKRHIIRMNREIKKKDMERMAEAEVETNCELCRLEEKSEEEMMTERECSVDSRQMRVKEWIKGQEREKVKKICCVIF